MICNACRLKLDSFKLFWLQYRANGNLLRVLRQSHPHSSGGGGIELSQDKLLNDVIKQQLGCLKPLDFSVAKEEVESVEAGLGSRTEERRRERNREASRRYRERARTNPDLLRRMREQQNARQKKYYARLRQRKQSFQVIITFSVYNITLYCFFRLIMKLRPRLQEYEPIIINTLILIFHKRFSMKYITA